MFRNIISASITRCILKCYSGFRFESNQGWKKSPLCPPSTQKCPCPTYPPCPPTCQQANPCKPVAQCRRIPVNPCCPQFPKPNTRTFKYIFFFVGLPLIVIQVVRSFSGDAHAEKHPCRDYEYMRRRTKNFPWGGTKSLFHNDHVNSLPGECEAVSKDTSQDPKDEAQQPTRQAS